MFRDVTELHDVQASREAFVGVLSHELRTPITTIYGAAKILQRSRTAAARRDLLSDVEAESDRLYRLVEDLLVLTRIERESLQVADEPVLVGPILRRVVAAEIARSLLSRIELELPDDLPMARGEDTYVEQILRNLVGNAAKYGPAGGLIRVVAAAQPDGGLEVRVLDEGPGVAAEDLERVFELLYSIARHGRPGRRLGDRPVREPASRGGDGRPRRGSPETRGRVRVRPPAAGLPRRPGAARDDPGSWSPARRPEPALTPSLRAGPSRRTLSPCRPTRPVANASGSTTG